MLIVTYRNFFYNKKKKKKKKKLNHELEGPNKQKSTLISIETVTVPYLKLKWF